MRSAVRIGAMLAAVVTAVTAQTGAASAEPSPDQAVVVTDSGALRGTVATDHRTFSGIPYAAPPVGDRRWRAPLPPHPWQTVRDATRPASPCLQMGGPAGSAVVGSEDCLYLNITTPAGRNARHLPVMVWLPGGGFVSGSGSDYDPTRLAVSGRVVVVTVNYRLGALGFLDHPALAPTEPAAGNFGIADQQAALRWVGRNIARFGGDAHNITLAGQSAGAYSTCTQLASPPAAGLFQKAIVQSGPCGNSMVTRPVAQTRGTQMARDLGCSAANDVPACLRGVAASRLVGIGGDRVFTATARIADLPWLPVAGTPMLPYQPLEAMRRGLAARVPLIQGSTRDEMRPFVGVNYDFQGHPLTADQYPGVLAQVFGADAAGVLARYPASAYPSPGVALATVLTDRGHKFGGCTVLSADQAASRRAPVYAYEFAEDPGQVVGGFAMGVGHGAELPYLFDGAYNDPGGSPVLNRQQQRLSREMIGYWSNFAATGNPNRTGLPHWSAYRGDGRLLSLVAGTAGITSTDFRRDHQCGFWNAIH
ncbi:carboxylesterase/lipase family protein [Micromonospora sp. CB01531]|uniref:carboxylesterase/lipase family protein n=1 Tax=Micromonospora sp. CB01531 TaxID=1718947 RepID=UPI0009F8D22D|nr:carboxylesterase family protein [Micromonospora sp. CB01531]